MPNIKKHLYASMLLSRFFNMRPSNRALISKPLNAFIESTCSHTQKTSCSQQPLTNQIPSRPTLPPAPTAQQPTRKRIHPPPVRSHTVQKYSSVRGHWNAHIPLTSKTTTITTFAWLRFKLHHQRRDVFCATFLFPVRTMGINQYLSRRAFYVSDACKHLLI